MRAALAGMWGAEDGQDVIEYSLLIAFVAVTAAALFMFGPGTSLRGLWSNGSNRLSAANSAAS